MEVERQDPNYQSSEHRGIPCKNHAKKCSHNPRDHTCKNRANNYLHNSIRAPLEIKSHLCKKCANNYLHNSAQHRHIPQCVKTFAETKNGHTGTLNKGRSHREKEFRQDLGHFLTAK